MCVEVSRKPGQDIVMLVGAQTARSVSQGAETACRDFLHVHAHKTVRASPEAAFCMSTLTRGKGGLCPRSTTCQGLAGREHSAQTVGDSWGQSPEAAMAFCMSTLTRGKGGLCPRNTTCQGPDGARDLRQPAVTLCVSTLTSCPDGRRQLDVRARRQPALISSSQRGRGGRQCPDAQSVRQTSRDYLHVHKRANCDGFLPKAKSVGFHCRL